MKNLSNKLNFQAKKIITVDWGPMSTNNVYKSVNQGEKFQKIQDQLL